VAAVSQAVQTAVQQISAVSALPPVTPSGSNITAPSADSAINNVLPSGGSSDTSGIGGGAPAGGAPAESSSSTGGAAGSTGSATTGSATAGGSTTGGTGPTSGGSVFGGAPASGAASTGSGGGRGGGPGGVAAPKAPSAQSFLGGKLVLVPPRPAFGDQGVSGIDQPAPPLGNSARW
jgi:hypothetical protein